jgi:hypothetical protein
MLAFAIGGKLAAPTEPMIEPPKVTAGAVELGKFITAPGM